jgi:hypothetical protein
VPEPQQPHPVVVVRAVVGDGRDRAALDYLGADGRWSCDRHPKAQSCAHLTALAEHVAGLVPEGVA